MSEAYRTFFAFRKEPFTAELEQRDILQTEDIKGVAERFNYAVRLGAMAIITGEVGSGKSTALRWAVSQLHPSEYKILWITASTGSILEVYRQLLCELEIDTAASSKAVLTRQIRRQVLDLIQGKKQKPVMVIDEASLLRMDVLTELHTITQFEGDSKPWLPMILAGQNNLVDKFEYRTSSPIASRVVAKSHLDSVNLEMMDQYLLHHLKIAGVKRSPFKEAAVTAIHQGSGGLFRKANHLARGALIAAAHEKSETVTSEHVRIALTELF